MTTTSANPRHQRPGGPFVWMVALLAVSGCAVRSTAPNEPRRDASFGHAPAGFDPVGACGGWTDAVDGDDTATTHVGYAEMSPPACFVRVRHGAGLARPEPVPPDCGYPRILDSTLATIRREADQYRAIAAGRQTSPPHELACSLVDEVRRVAASHNARTMDALRRRLARGERFPYAAIGTFGYGHGAMDGSDLVPWRPGRPCPRLSKRQMDLLSVMRVRAGRAAAAYLGDVAPVVLVSGGAVHASLVEAFALHYLLSCRFDVPSDAVLLDPCADHTHTNIRNMGGLVVALGGRTAYLVTDDGLQADYLQEYNAFHLIGGSIDQRSLRDFGYLLGSWRQASVGIDAGFWYTPYRFWAAPPDRAGGATCVR